jgi:hypothetical protein
MSTIKIYPTTEATDYWRDSAHTRESAHDTAFAGITGPDGIEYIWPVPFNLSAYAGKPLVSLKFFAKRDDSESNGVSSTRTISTGHSTSDATLAAVTTNRVAHGNARSMPDGDSWVSWDISAAWAELQTGTRFIVLRGNTYAYTGFFTNDANVAVANRPYIELVYQDNPNLTTPGKPSSPGTVVGDTAGTSWGASSDLNGVLAAGNITYRMAVSPDGGANWTYYDIGAGVLSFNQNFWNFLGCQNGVDKYATCKFSVQARVLYNGAYYESGWIESDSFAVDYRFSPPTPSVSPIPTVTTDSYVFDWSDVGPANGAVPVAQTDYETDISSNGGTSYLSGMTVNDASSRTISGLHALLGVTAGQYYINNGMKFSVRAKVTTAHGAYYSGYVQPTFTIDWRSAPSAIPAPTISKASAYEGESITLTCKRPANYNPKDSAGNTNSLIFIAWRESVGEVGRTTILVTDSRFTTGEGAIPIMFNVGEWTSGLNDLSTSFRVLVRDEDTQGTIESGWSANVAFTCRRFRTPSIVVVKTPRSSDTVTVNITISDTGFAATQVKEQIRKVEYKLASGVWTLATLGVWNGLSTTFTLTGLDGSGRYNLEVRVTNVAPVLADKVSAVYLAVILEFTPALFPWYDPTTGYSGAATKSLIVGNDFNNETCPVEPGWGYFQNGIKVGTGTVWHSGNINPIPIKGYVGLSTLNSAYANVCPTGTYWSDYNTGFGVAWRHYINLAHRDNNGFGAQITFPYGNQGNINAFWRCSSGGTQLAWRQLWDSENKPDVRCGAYRTSSFSVADSTDTLITFDAEFYDTHNMFAPGSQSINIVKDGIYLAVLQVQWASNATGTREIRVKGRVNGNAYNGMADDRTGVGSGRDTGQMVTDVVRCISGDYLQAAVWQGSGGALNIYYTNFFVIRIA